MELLHVSATSVTSSVKANPGSKSK